MFLRLNRLPKPRFQLRLALGFLLTAVLAALVQTVALGWSLGELADSTRAPGVWEHIPEILQRNLISTLKVLVPLVMSAGILLSFRIAGPLYSIERYLRDVARDGPGAPGTKGRRCSVRNRDELQELCRLVNAAVDRLREEDEPAGGVEMPERDPSRLYATTSGVSTSTSGLSSSPPSSESCAGNTLR
jgi:hypothetical protein